MSLCPVGEAGMVVDLSCWSEDTSHCHTAPGGLWSHRWERCKNINWSVVLLTLGLWQTTDCKVCCVVFLMRMRPEHKKVNSTQRTGPQKVGKREEMTSSRQGIPQRCRTCEIHWVDCPHRLTERVRYYFLFLGYACFGVHRWSWSSLHPTRVSISTNYVSAPTPIWMWITSKQLRSGLSLIFLHLQFWTSVSIFWTHSV